VKLQGNRTEKSASAHPVGNSLLKKEGQDNESFHIEQLG
jgi:hypothetical protein